MSSLTSMKRIVARGSVCASSGVPFCSSARRRSPSVCKATAQQGEGGFVADVLKIAKRIQGALPIVGLVSRLAAPEGGFDELAYPEFCRAQFDKAPREMSQAMQELERRHGKLATSRWVLLLGWMVTQGLGAVPAKDISAAARRLRVTADIAVEIDRFEGARLASRKKYNMMAPPVAKLEEKATTLTDALCTLCLGLKDEQPVPPEDAKLLVPVLMGMMPELSKQQAEASVTQRGGAQASTV